MNLETLDQLSLLVKSISNSVISKRQADSYTIKPDKSWVTHTDLEIENRLKEYLLKDFPESEFIGEESHTGEELGSGLNWILDPVDGTTNYVTGLPYYATSLGLVDNGLPVAGIVYDPCRDELFTALKGQGAWLNGRRLMLPQEVFPMIHSIAMVEHKRLPQALALNLVANQPYKSHRSFGAVALEWCWLASGRTHLYLTGSKKLWDYSAGYLIMSEAGGYATDLFGASYLPYDIQTRSICAAINQATHEQFFNLIQKHLNG